MLYYSSLLILPVVWAAHLFGDTGRLFAYSSLVATSVLHHGKWEDRYAGKRLVALTDRMLARCIWLFEFRSNAQRSQDVLVSACLAYILVAYGLELTLLRKHARVVKAVHVTIHLACAVGACKSCVVNGPALVDTVRNGGTTHGSLVQKSH